MPAAVGRPARVHRQRLADDDGRLGRQQPALGLVDGARDAVEPGREVDDRRLAEPLVALPARRLGEREVDLHLASGRSGTGARGGEPARRTVEEPAVELGRRDVAITARSRRDRLAVRRAARRRAPVRDEHALDVAPGLAARRRGRGSAPTSASASRAPPPRGIGIPPSWIATAITWAMKPEAAASGPSPVCSTHGASRPCARSDANVSVSQSRLETSRPPANSAAPRRPSRR